MVDGLFAVCKSDMPRRQEKEYLSMLEQLRQTTEKKGEAASIQIRVAESIEPESDTLTSNANQREAAKSRRSRKVESTPRSSNRQKFEKKPAKSKSTRTPALSEKESASAKASGSCRKQKAELEAARRHENRWEISDSSSANLAEYERSPVGEVYTAKQGVNAVLPVKVDSREAQTVREGKNQHIV